MDVLFFLLLLCCLWVYVYVPCHNLQMFGKNNVNPLSFFQATRSTNLRQWALRMPRGHLRSGNEGEGRSGFRGYFSYCYVWVHPSVIYKFEIRQVFHTVFGVSVGKTECWAGRMWSTHRGIVQSQQVGYHDREMWCRPGGRSPRSLDHYKQRTVPGFMSSTKGRMFKNPCWICICICKWASILYEVIQLY